MSANDDWATFVKVLKISLVKSSWRKHLIICLFLGLLAVPIYFLARPDPQSLVNLGGETERK
jgi:hypothetical protein